MRGGADFWSFLEKFVDRFLAFSVKTYDVAKYPGGGGGFLNDILVLFCENYSAVSLNRPKIRPLEKGRGILMVYPLISLVLNRIWP